MVVASASKMQEKKLYSLPPAEMAATAMVPRPFTAVCIITEPMAVMENCKPMGTPMPISRRAKIGRKRRSSFCMRRMGKRFTSMMTHPTPEASWLMMVASAAPATPIWNTRMNRRSSAIFTREVMARKYTGVLLSPRERMMPLAILYSMITGMAANTGRI